MTPMIVILMTGDFRLSSLLLTSEQELAEIKTLYTTITATATTLMIAMTSEDQ